MLIDKKRSRNYLHSKNVFFFRENVSGECSFIRNHCDNLKEKITYIMYTEWSKQADELNSSPGQRSFRYKNLRTATYRDQITFHNKVIIQT